MSPRAGIRLALLAAGERAVVTGPSALYLHGFDLSQANGLGPLGGYDIYLSVPSNRHREVERVVILRDKQLPDKTWIDGMPVALRTAAVIDALRVLPIGEARAVMFRALQARWLDADCLHSATQRLYRRRGNAQLTMLLKDARSGAHAESEALMVRILRKAGLRDFEVNFRVGLEDGKIAYIDIAFIKEMLAIELDGRAWHTQAERFQHDRTRQVALMDIGWTVMRLTWEDINERPTKVIHSILRQLGRQ